MPCKYLIRAGRITESFPDLAKTRYKCICNKFDDIDGYIEEEDYRTYCNADDYINCSVFKYMSKKCEKLSLKLARGGKYKIPIVNLDEAKYKPVCTKAKDMEDKYDFIFCDDDSYVNCPIYKHEVDSKP